MTPVMLQHYQAFTQRESRIYGETANHEYYNSLSHKHKGARDICKSPKQIHIYSSHKMWE